jgi:hypothetical protein
MSPPAVEVLTAGLLRLAEVRMVRMPDTVAHLVMGERPVLWLDVDSSPEALCWALLDVLRVLVLGPEHAQHGRHVRHLRAVT